MFDCFKFTEVTFRVYSCTPLKLCRSCSVWALHFLFDFFFFFRFLTFLSSDSALFVTLACSPHHYWDKIILYSPHALYFQLHHFFLSFFFLSSCREHKYTQNSVPRVVLLKDKRKTFEARQPTPLRHLFWGYNYYFFCLVFYRWYHSYILLNLDGLCEGGEGFPQSSPSCGVNYLCVSFLFLQNRP